MRGGNIAPLLFERLIVRRSPGFEMVAEVRILFILYPDFLIPGVGYSILSRFEAFQAALLSPQNKPNFSTKYF